MNEPESLSVCVLIPCLNNQGEIGNVVRSYREWLPDCRVFVVDNCSTQETIELARRAGGEVLVERRRGEAQAVISALPLIDSDVLILAKADGTYPVEGARRMLEYYRWEKPDMIVGVASPREGKPATSDFEARILRFAFGHPPEDLHSGLRLLSKFFYKNIPILLRGFSLEVELTVQALDKNFRIATVPVPQLETEAESSKGQGRMSAPRRFARSAHFVITLLRDYKPMILFGFAAALFALTSLAIGSVSIYDYFTTGIVHRLLLPVLAASLMILGFITIQVGVVLESSLRYRRETYQTQLRRHFDPRAN